MTRIALLHFQLAEMQLALLQLQMGAYLDMVTGRGNWLDFVNPKEV